MRALVRRFRELRSGEVTLVMDNARIHKARRVTEFFRENGVEFQYLPPYTPDLNPIENVFGTVKANYRSAGIPMNRDAMKAQLSDILEHFKKTRSRTMGTCGHLSRRHCAVRASIDRWFWFCWFMWSLVWSDIGTKIVFEGSHCIP